MITVEEQLSRVLADLPRLPSEPLAVAAALGRVLGVDVAARVPIPAWDNSAMDGYAVRAADCEGASPGEGVTLRVLADLPAGSDLDPPLHTGEAARIMTGAVLPSAADAVVPLESTNRTDPLADLADTVTVYHSPRMGAHIRRSGEDKSTGAVVTKAGAVVTPELAASVASAGHGTVVVARRPRVAVIATGSELVHPGVELGRGQIPDSNSLLISGLAGGVGSDVVEVRRVGDEPTELASALEQTAECDVVILTGGVSAGAHDPVKRVFAGSDAVRFSRVAMQPGKPQAFGRLSDGRVLFGLPGNPVSAWVSFQVFVRPALRAMQGGLVPSAAPLSARVVSGWRVPDGRRQYLPAVIAPDQDGAVTVAPVAARGSGSHLVEALRRRMATPWCPLAMAEARSRRGNASMWC